MDLFLILGNQLFSPRYFPKIKKQETFFFMREDQELCTHLKYHKKKIHFFFSAMRKYAVELEKEGFRVAYQTLGTDQKKYESALLDFIKVKKVKRITVFEIEDKFFETRMLDLFKKENLEVQVLESPMFLTKREEFKGYLQKVKKPFMKTFYESQRKRMKILVNSKGEPVGGKWSFDEDNRLPLPQNYEPPSLPKVKLEKVDLEISRVVNENFPSHPGSTEDLWLPTDRRSAHQWLRLFLQERLALFGPYEDALSKQFPFINHSVLTPLLNVGLLTPGEIVEETLDYSASKKISINSVEGFLRQIIGWREFVRGIYQNFSEKQDKENFFQHKRKLKPCWYNGTTGIEPLDDVIQKTVKYGYAHHIERLMVVGSLMLLLEIEPREAHRWFMEMFVDSSDWVMGPNVYGMALFSDGGIFATKPYFCGSNYYKKMGPYKKGDWQQGVDGLYWSFINRNRKFFSLNPRLSMMVRTLDKMDVSKKEKIFKEAEALKERLTQSPKE